MQFLHEQPSFSLVEGTKTDTFVADVFQPRPDFDQLAAFHQWGADAREKMLEAMGRKIALCCGRLWCLMSVASLLLCASSTAFKLATPRVRPPA